MAQSPEKIAYIAGLFDGEGCVFLSKLGKGAERIKGCGATISMTDSPPLFLVQEMFGGNVLEGNSGSRGKRKIWRWQIQGIEAERFYEAILPYLEAKEIQASIALLLLATFRLTTRGRPVSEEIQNIRNYLGQEILNARLINE